MAEYTIADGDIAVHDKTIVADTVDIVQFETDPPAVEILTDGAAPLYVTVDDSEPEVSGSTTYILPAVMCSRTIRHSDRVGRVKLISDGTPKYSVMMA